MHDQQLCEICAEAVSYLDYLSQKDGDTMVCRSHECQRLIQQKQALAPALFDAQLKFHKDRLRERVEKQAEEKARLEAVNLAQSAENQRIRRAYLEESPESHPDNLYTLSIPSGLSGLSELSEQRKIHYREHLEEVIDQALSYPDSDAVPREDYQRSINTLQEARSRLDSVSELRSVSDSVCVLCKGGCCCNGADAAYISVLTVRTYMDSNPGLSGNDVLESYLDKLDSHSIDGACINQTSNGCALPRDMRSDICNGYYCGPLKAYQKQSSSSGELPPALIIQRSNTNWMQLASHPENRVTGTAVVTPEGIQNIEIQDPERGGDSARDPTSKEEQGQAGIR